MKDLSFYMSLNYKIEILREEEGTGYVLRCPELPGCITSAENIEEGMRLIEDAKKCWITACLENGVPVPEPTTCEASLSENSKRDGISMKDLAIKRNLDEETRKQGIVIAGKVYSLHITANKEVIITDFSDYTKIYCIYSWDFYVALNT